MKQRIKDICNIARYGNELRIVTPMKIYWESGRENFQEQQDALNRLKEDPELEITEKDIKVFEKEINDDYWYKIITIKFKGSIFYKAQEEEWLNEFTKPTTQSNPNK